MVDILEIVFRSFWTWLGTLILVENITWGIRYFMSRVEKEFKRGK